MSDRRRRDDAAEVQAPPAARSVDREAVSSVLPPVSEPVAPPPAKEVAPRDKAPAPGANTGPEPAGRPQTFRVPKPAEPPVEAAPRSSRVRSQPLDVRPPPVLPEPAVEEMLAPPQGSWRWTPMVAGLAAIAWIAALGLLVTGAGTLEGRVASPRLLLAAAWGLAALITFAPIEFRLGLPGVTWQGVAGWVLLGYTLAFVPPPTGWLLDLPDAPVYLLFFVALFYAVSSAALPLTYLLGQRIYTRRMHQQDLRRSRRQAHELGVLGVALMVLAALRVLSPLTALLVVAAVVLVETLLLSQVAPES